MSSRPSRDQRGDTPPLNETAALTPGPGNAVTYTSSLPDSSDTYASQCPSGESFAPRTLALGSSSTTCGVASPIRKAQSARGSPVRYNSVVPSGDQDVGNPTVPGTGSRTSGLRLASAGTSSMA